MMTAGSAFARQSTFIEVESKVDTSVITIGDRITYSLVIRRDPELNIVRPGAGANLGMFEIKDYNFPEPEEENGYISERFDFEISVFDTGHYKVPAFPVAYFKEDSSEYQIIQAEPVDIYVRSLLSGEESPELKDVKPPIDLPFNYWYWMSMGAIALLLLLIGFFGYRLWKQRREKGYLFKPPPAPKPAHEVAMLELNELFHSGLLEKEEYKAFFSKLTDILRTYMEGRYFFSAMEETTAEIMNNLRSNLDSEPLREDMHGLLTLADLVKFAKHIPDSRACLRSKEVAVRFVEETKIVYVSAGEPEEKSEPVPEEQEPIAKESVE
jgi:hypothetical protein